MDAVTRRNAKKSFFCVLCKFLCFLWFSCSISVNLCQSVDRDAKDAKDTKDAKGNAKTQRKQRRRGRKEKFFLCSLQISVFSVVFFFQSVKICVNRWIGTPRTPRTQRAPRVTQRRGGNRGAEDAKKSFFCVLCKFLCFLWFSFSIGVNLCQSVDENPRLHRLAQIFSAESAVTQNQLGVRER